MKQSTIYQAIVLALSIALYSTACGQSIDDQRLILKLNESHKVCLQENQSLHAKIELYNQILEVRQQRINNLESVVEEAGKIDEARVAEINNLSDVNEKQRKQIVLLKTITVVSVIAIPVAFTFGLIQ